MSDEVAEAHSIGSKVCPAVIAWFRAEWAAVLFVVCLVTVLHHSVLAPVSKLSLLIVSNLATPANVPEPEEPKVIVVTINNVDFEDRYSERTPLNRCKLVEDLETVLQKLAPSVLAVDLDLSPVLDESGVERSCQYKLNELLRKSSGGEGPKIIAIDLWANVELADSRLIRAKKSWLSTFDNAVNLADPRFDLHLKVAMESRRDEKRLAERVYAASSSPDGYRVADRRSSTKPINYRAFLQHHRVMTMLTLRNPIAAAVPLKSKGKIVFFGGDYGRDDAHVTPVGKYPGVMVHAARFVSLLLPVARSEWLNFGLDLLVASLFSVLVDHFVRRYCKNATAHVQIRRHRKAGVLLLFFIIYIALVIIVLWAAQGFFAAGYVIEPLLIGVGLAIDGFIVKPWHHLGAHGHDAPPSSGHCFIDIRDTFASWRHAILAWWQRGLKEDWAADRVATVCYVGCRLAFYAVVLIALSYVVGLSH